MAPDDAFPGYLRALLVARGISARLLNQAIYGRADSQVASVAAGRSTIPEGREEEWADAFERLRVPLTPDERERFLYLAKISHALRQKRAAPVVTALATENAALRAIIADLTARIERLERRED